MSDTPRFDASLPTPYKEDWRKAYRADPGESPRMASYQAPGGEAIPFIQKSFRFSGGQAKDTAEYPFGGLWSNEYLNEKPQSLTVDGYLRGPAYIAQRNKLIEALRVPTDDDNPGYIDLPFWSRFPVVVNDNYEISETADEQGQCAVSISFTRAGVSIDKRMGALSNETGNKDALLPASVQLENAKKNLQAVAIDDFDKKLNGRMDIKTLHAAFGEMKGMLLSVLGRIQGAQTILNGITNEILGIMNLINRGSRIPREFAQALLNAGMSIPAGVLEIKSSVALYGRKENRASNKSASATSLGTSPAASSADDSTAPSLPYPDNERNILITFLSAATYALSEKPAVTPSQEATITACENIFRTTAFLVSAWLIANMDSLTYKKAGAYWRLLEKLEESINRENPAIYAAIQNVHTALSRELSEREISREMTRLVFAEAPLLYLAYYLGCDEDKIRGLNSIADSFVVEGAVIYV